MRERKREREERVLSHVEMRGTSVIAAMGTSKYFWGATHFVQIFNELIFFRLMA